MTNIGWIIYGPKYSDTPHTPAVMYIKDNEIHDIVKEFIEIENFGSNPNAELILSDENQHAKNIMQHTTQKVENRFETAPSRFEMAKKRLLTVEKR